MLAAGAWVVKPALAWVDRRVLIKELASGVHPLRYQSHIHGQTSQIPMAHVNMWMMISNCI